jgi:molybdopterin-guanine dinucleotide biosynthesis protein A
MGRDKALIEIDGEPLIARVSRRLAEVADPVFIAAGRKRYPVEYEHIEDAAPDSGPLGGIVAALRASPHDLLAVVAVDMPFVSPSLFTHLVGRHSGSDAVVPEDEDGLQPLHAVYAVSALPKLEAALAEGELSMRSVLGRLRTEMVQWDGRGFGHNLNEPADLRRVVENTSGGWSEE